MATNKKHLAAGIGIVLSLFGLTWYASNFIIALVFWSLLLATKLFVLYLLYRKTKPARVGAAFLEISTIFLLFMPRHIKDGMVELKRRESEKL